jgi:hypothetical protein
MPESFEKSFLSGVGNHPDFQVTFCHHFVITNVDFAYIESEKMSIFCENTNIFDNFGLESDYDANPCAEQD